MRRALSLLVVVVALALPATAAAATGSPIVITFTGDPHGPKPNGFHSVASPDIAFWDTMGAGLSLETLPYHQTDGQSLVINPDDASAVEIRLARPTTALSLAFGNDDPEFADTSDLARLTLYRGGDQVARRSVRLNANDEIDQRIGERDGPLFDRAVFQYVDPGGTPLHLAEIIDDIRINPLCTVAGTSGPDQLVATQGSDVICGGPGNDVISSRRGADVVYGGPGRDTIKGGRGADVLRGGPGRDHLSGGRGDDTCLGGPGRDAAIGCEHVRSALARRHR